MLETVKVELSTEEDDTILDLIESARMDLIIAGVKKDKADETTAVDPLIKRAIILYCKANYKYDPYTEKYQALYLHLKQHLSLAEEYKEVKQ